MAKSADAFRTISEVSDWLDTPAHVLRFWESRFSQIKPVKRAGGRRYYRPRDMQLLGGIKQLLHEDGLTVKGVQKILKEKGVRYVSSLSAEVTDPDSPKEAAVQATTPAPAIPRPAEPAQTPPAAPQAAEPAPEREEAPGPIPSELAQGAPDAIVPQAIDDGISDDRLHALYTRLRGLRDRLRSEMAAE